MKIIILLLIYYFRYDTLIKKITFHISNLGHIYQGLNITAKNHLIKNDINESDIGKYTQQ